MTANLVLETKQRDPIPQGLSYPLGLERLTAGLAAVPHSKLPVYFCGRGPGRLGWFVPCQSLRRLHGGNHYRAYQYSEVLAGWQVDGSWAVIVSAVTSSRRAAVWDALESTGLSLLADWLSLPRFETWHFGDRRFQIAFDSQVAGMCTREIHEDRVVFEEFLDVRDA